MGTTPDGHFINHVIMGDGTFARLWPEGCVNRIREDDGHLSCNHGDGTGCARDGHETVTTYTIDPITSDEFRGDPDAREKWDALRQENARLSIKLEVSEQDAEYWAARAGEAEAERNQFRSQAALFQRRVAELEQPMTTVHENGTVYRVLRDLKGEGLTVKSETWRNAEKCRLVPIMEAPDA